MRILAATIGLIFAASTANAAQLDLIWTSTTGTGAGVGTDTIIADTGDTLTLDLVLSLAVLETASILGVSIEFDNDGADELSIGPGSVTEGKHAATYGCVPFPTCYISFGPALTNTTAGIASSLDSVPGTGGFVYTFEQGTLGTGPTGPIAINMGTVTFTVNTAIADGVDIVSGTFNTGVDGNFQNDGSPLAITFNGATVDGPGAVVPEPTTAALLALGLAGLGLAGRNRR